MNKVIVITGGSDGIGKAIAKRLSKENKVVIIAHNEEKTKKAAEEIGCDCEVADVTSWEQLDKAVKAVVEKQGRIDVFINNAGLWIQGPIETNDPKDIEKTVAVNVTGVMLGVALAVPIMKQQKSGFIINVSSQAGLYAKPERSVYNATKWAVTGFTKSLQGELAPHGIKVTGLYPGYIDTQMFEKVGITKDPNKAISPDDVAKAVEFMINADDNIVFPEIGIQNANY